jgi:magnesium-transporting ATPase (P-type)
MLYNISKYIKKHPSRVSGYISALIIYLNKSFPNIPIEIIIPTVMFVIGMGESVQRVENKKTLKALYAKNDPNTPDDEILSGL